MAPPSAPPAEGPGPRRPGKLERYRDPEVVRAYDHRWASAAGARRNRRKGRALQRALELLAATTGAGPVAAWTILDAPCGNGRFAGLLGRRCRRYLGLDLSQAMLGAARERLPEGRLLAGDLLRLPLADDAVDVAVCIRFLHLLRAPWERISVLRELGRVARHGVVADYRHSRTLRVAGRRLRHRLGLLPHPPANPSPAAIRAEVAAAGGRLRAWLPVHRAPGFSDKVLVLFEPARTGSQAGAAYA